MNAMIISIFANRSNDLEERKVLEEKIQRMEKNDRILVMSLIFGKGLVGYDELIILFRQRR